MKTQAKEAKETKDIVVGTKFAPSLVALLDAEAERLGATRSYVLRRIALEYFQSREARESVEVAS